MLSTLQYEPIWNEYQSNTYPLLFAVNFQYCHSYTFVKKKNLISFCPVMMWSGSTLENSKGYVFANHVIRYSWVFTFYNINFLNKALYQVVLYCFPSINTNWKKVCIALFIFPWGIAKILSPPLEFVKFWHVWSPSSAKSFSMCRLASAEKTCAEMCGQMWSLSNGAERSLDILSFYWFHYPRWECSVRLIKS